MAKNWAIAIGINQYANLQLLQYAKRDAETMRDWFEKEAGFERVFLFTDDSPEIPAKPSPIPTHPTYGHLWRFLRAQFEKPLLKEGDNLWFFFAGHGRRYEDRDYLMLSDSDPGDVEHTAIAVDYVTQRLRRSGADNVVLFLDACRDEGRAGEGIGDQHQGVVTFYACSPKERSYEIEALQQGTFTHALLEALRIQGAGNCATVERLDEYLRRRVPQINRQYNKNSQAPYALAEPATKLHLILLPRSATQQDIATLKNDALLAEVKQNWELARQLWMRVNIAAAGADLDAIEAIGRFAHQVQPAEFSHHTVTDKSGVRSELPTRPKLPWKLIALGILPAIAFLVVMLNFFPPKSLLPPPAISPTPTSPTSQPTPQPGIQTVQVKSKNALQHGFFTRNGYIITAKPAIGDAREVTVIWQRDNEKQQGQARVEKSGKYDPQVILLKLTGTNIPQQVLPIRISRSLQVGERVERYLAPYDRTPGKVLKVGATQEIWVSSDSKFTLRNALITTSILAPGDAGAPVVDTEGRVVAMGYGGNQTETISIPIEDIKLNFPEAF